MGILLGQHSGEWPLSFRSLLARWRFTSVVERWIKGATRARIKKLLRAAPHHGPEYVAWSCVSESILA
eukprot:13064825-Alexandrium_andersonii.AAC.1